MKSEFPLISIIIPTYKRPVFLARAINSALKQTYPNIEIIVVDDNNEGDIYRKETSTVMENYNSNPRIIYLKHSKNCGAAEARNSGIKVAKGEYIGFLDDDDEFLPDKILKQYQKFKESNFPNLGLVYCWAKEINTTGQTQRIIKKQVRGQALIEHLKQGLCGTPFILVPRKVIKEAGLFNHLPAAIDYDLIFRILKHGYSVDFVPEILLFIYLHKQQRISLNTTKIIALDYIFSQKQKYFSLLNRQEKKNIKLRYYLSKAYIYLANQNYYFSLYNYLLALRFCFFHPKLLSFALNYFFGLKTINKLKVFFVKLKNLFIA